jgi:thioredoxin-like negative regulator of GroEL
MDYFLSILKKDREFQNDIGRRGMLSIFHTLGKENSSIVDKYRSMMFNELH